MAGEGLVEHGRVGGIGGQLLADHIAHLAAHAGDEDQATDILASGGGEGDHQRAFRMAEQEDALVGFPFGLDRVDPGMDVVDISLRRGDVGIASTGRTKHAALVDADGGDAVLDQAFGQKLVGVGAHAHRVVAITVGRARAGDDQHDRVAVARVDHRAVQFAGGDIADHRFNVSIIEVLHEGDGAAHDSDGRDDAGDRAGLLGGFFADGFALSLLHLPV